jgi:type IV pilus assembly protein PilB
MADFIASIPQYQVGLPVVKAAVVLVLTIPWLYFAPWVHRDATKLTPSPATWDGLVLAAGAIGVAAWLALPLYIVGLLFYAVLAVGSMLVYVAYRNGRVADTKNKVLTREHLKKLFGRAGGPKKQTIEILTKVTMYDHIEKVVHPPDMTKATPEEIEAYNLVQELLSDLVWRRASEAALMPAGQQAQLTYVIDGVASKRPGMSQADSEKVIQFLKGVTGMSLTEVRQPQKGPMSVDLLGHRADMELNTAGTTGGQRMAFRVIQEVARTRLDELGMPEDILAEMRRISQLSNGLFIISGRRASGVTSTLYSMLREHDAFTKNIVTIEAARAVELENIDQQIYGQDDQLAKVLTNVLRRGLDVLMVDNCPDAAAAKLIIQAAAKRPVLLGLEANDSFVALAKWVKTVGDPATAASALRGVMCQMLMRKLCEQCREAYRPDPKAIAKLNITAEKIEQFYRPGEPPEDKKGQLQVCSACQGSGYKGRTAVFEQLLLNSEIRQLIAAGATVAQIRTACRKNKMLYLQEQALRKVMDGTTSIDEVIRVTQQQAKK